MDKNVKKQKQKNNVLLGAIILGLVVSVVIYVVMLNAEKNALSAYEKGTVYVAAKSIPKGTVISDMNCGYYFKITELDQSVIAPSAVTDINQLIGMIPQSSIDEGTLITKGMFRHIDTIISEMKEPVIAGFTVDDLYQVVGGTLRAGDRIHIYSVDEENNARLIWSNVYVQQVFDNIGINIPNSDNSTAAQRINVYMDNSDIAQFYSELTMGSLRVVKVCDY